ncbi:MAG: ribosome silencing factor [Phycisphaerae bacterium]|jgi:ribosome-associated protein
MSAEPLPRAPQPSPADDALAFAVQAARIAFEHRAEDIRVLDVRGLSSLADAFVIGTGTSDRQMRAVLDRLDQFARSVGRKRFNISGTQSSNWVLADYIDVVIHLFDPARRGYYDLDGLWGDAPLVEWRPAAVGAVPAEPSPGDSD